MSRHRKLIPPSHVEEAAKKKEKENKRFRSFLKKRADPDELDMQFKELHNRIFPLYDCKRCRNCCKLLSAQIPGEDIDRIASFLNMSREEFVDKHLQQEELGEWIEKHSPCGFLSETGECRLGKFCPKSCKDFPYTNQPDRLFSLYSILNAVSVCPAAYEIFEALKELYDFDTYRRNLRKKPYYQNGGFSFPDDLFSSTATGGCIEQEDLEEKESDFEVLPF